MVGSYWNRLHTIGDKMAYVTVRKGEDINRALRRFKKKVEKEGIMKEEENNKKRRNGE